MKALPRGKRVHVRQKQVLKSHRPRHSRGISQHGINKPTWSPDVTAHVAVRRDPRGRWKWDNSWEVIGLEAKWCLPAIYTDMA